VRPAHHSLSVLTVAPTPEQRLNKAPSGEHVGRVTVPGGTTTPLMVVLVPNDQYWRGWGRAAPARSLRYKSLFCATLQVCSAAHTSTLLTGL
jgi:hypothetical protein